MGKVSAYSVAFIESRDSGVDQVFERHIAEGRRHFNIFPMFFSASHYSRDIPQAIDKVKKNQDFEYTLTPVLSYHPLMQRLIEKRISGLPSGGAVMVMAHGNTEYERADCENEELLSQVEAGPSFQSCLKADSRWKMSYLESWQSMIQSMSYQLLLKMAS